MLEFAAAVFFLIITPGPGVQRAINVAIVAASMLAVVGIAAVAQL